MLSSTEPEIHAVDISETDLRQKFPEALEILLRDHTTKRNIFWATDDYKSLGPGYAWHDPICAPLITGDQGKVIMPRVKKDRTLQTARIRDMAEVFTPSWVCNAQNNLVDSAWFGRENVFNTEISEGNNAHGTPDAQEKDRIIREELRNEGYEIITIPAVELDDKKAMTGYFRRIAKFLVGREYAQQIANNPEWF